MCDLISKQFYFQDYSRGHGIVGGYPGYEEEVQRQVQKMVCNLEQ